MCEEDGESAAFLSLHNSQHLCVLLWQAFAAEAAEQDGHTPSWKCGTKSKEIACHLYLSAITIAHCE